MGRKSGFSAGKRRRELAKLEKRKRKELRKEERRLQAEEGERPADEEAVLDEEALPET